MSIINQIKRELKLGFFTKVIQLYKIGGNVALVRKLFRGYFLETENDFLKIPKEYVVRKFQHDDSYFILESDNYEGKVYNVTNGYFELVFEGSFFYSEILKGYLEYRRCELYALAKNNKIYDVKGVGVNSPIKGEFKNYLLKSSKDGKTLMDLDLEPIMSGVKIERIDETQYWKVQAISSLTWDIFEEKPEFFENISKMEFSRIEKTNVDGLFAIIKDLRLGTYNVKNHSFVEIPYDVGKLQTIHSAQIETIKCKNGKTKTITIIELDIMKVCIFDGKRHNVFQSDYGKSFISGNYYIVKGPVENNIIIDLETFEAKAVVSVEVNKQGKIIGATVAEELTLEELFAKK